MKLNLRPISLASRFLLLALAIPSINDAFVSVEVSPMVNKMLEGRSRIFSSTLRSLDENGGSSSDNRERRGVGSLGGRGGRGRGGRSSRAPSSSSTRPNKKQSFGPNGHDYQQSTVDSIATSNNSMFTESDIHILLANRLQAKFDRDFPTADAIQMELINGGVYIQDELREWRADGVPYESNGSAATGGRKKNDNTRNMQYTKSPHSSSHTKELQQTTINDDLVNKLVHERAKFKFTRQYDKADLVREGLRTKFNVIIDDRLRQWSVGGDFGSEHNAVRESMELLGSRGYIKSSSSLSAADYGVKRNNDVDNDGDDNDETTMDNDDGQEMEEYIQYHVDARAAMKKEGKFDTADKIRLDLAQRFDVVINDKLKLWSIGGVFEEMGDSGSSANIKPRGVYTRRGGGSLTIEEEAAITKLLSDRYHAQRQRNYSAADEIRDLLMNRYNVSIDDRSREWRVDTDEYARKEGCAHSLSEKEVHHIESRLKERFVLKRDHMYEDADAIRDDLRSRFGVAIDDRTKEWFVE